MKSIILSCAPTECEKIANGNMSILVRKKVPKEVPFKAYVYVTKDKPYLYGDMPIKEFYLDNGGYKGGECNGIKLCNGKVIGEFICDKIYPIKGEYTDGGSAERRHKSIETFLSGEAHNELLFATCLEIEELFDYLGNGKWGYGLHITALKIYGKPKELSEFISPSKAKKCVDYCVNGICSNLGYEELCGAIRRCEYKKITRPPKNYIYVEEQENSNE